MLRYFFLIFLVKNALGDFCVTYTFDETFNDIFSNNFGVCNDGMNQWNIGSYENINLAGFNPLSTKFIYAGPENRMSCASSFIFPMNYEGVIEINVYMETTSATDMLSVIAFQYITGFTDPALAQVTNISPGWNTLRMTLLAGSFKPFDGYISLLGMVSPGSIVLVDSFRYIPPDMNETDCELYLPANTTPIDTTVDTTPSTDQIITESTIFSELTTEAIGEETTPPIDGGKCIKNTLYIILIVLVSIILLILYTTFVYCLGKRRGKKDILRLVSLVNARSNVIPDNRDPRFVSRVNPMYNNNA